MTQPGKPATAERDEPEYGLFLTARELATVDDALTAWWPPDSEPPAVHAKVRARLAEARSRK